MMLEHGLRVSYEAGSADTWLRDSAVLLSLIHI